MPCLLVQYDDRAGSQFDTLIAHTRAYAQRHQIEYTFGATGFEHLPPWWRKVFFVQELLPHYDAVMWVDTDATIVGDFPFKQLFQDGHFAFSPNPPMLNNPALSMLSAPFCAGVWAVRNTPEGRALMDLWASAYKPEHWTLDGAGTWRGAGAYGGAAYEQGAFELNIYRCSELNAWLQELPAHVMNYLAKPDHALSGRSCPSDVFAVHYWKGNRRHINTHFPAAG
jgi:hypothetical protein